MLTLYKLTTEFYQTAPPLELVGGHFTGGAESVFRIDELGERVKTGRLITLYRHCKRAGWTFKHDQTLFGGYWTDGTNFYRIV